MSESGSVLVLCENDSHTREVFQQVGAIIREVGSQTRRADWMAEISRRAAIFEGVGCEFRVEFRVEFFSWESAGMWGLPGRRFALVVEAGPGWDVGSGRRGRIYADVESRLTKGFRWIGYHDLIESVADAESDTSESADLGSPGSRLATEDSSAVNRCRRFGSMWPESRGVAGEILKLVMSSRPEGGFDE